MQTMHTKEWIEFGVIKKIFKCYKNKKVQKNY